MQINFILIGLSFFAPIIRLFFEVAKTREKIIPRIYIMEWLASGSFACLVQFLGIEIGFIKEHEIGITITTALFARKIFTFVDENIKPYVQRLLEKHLPSKRKKD